MHKSTEEKCVLYPTTGGTNHATRWNFSSPSASLCHNDNGSLYFSSTTPVQEIDLLQILKNIHSSQVFLGLGSIHIEQTYLILILLLNKVQLLNCIWHTFLIINQSNNRREMLFFIVLYQMYRHSCFLIKIWSNPLTSRG